MDPTFKGLSVPVPHANVNRSGPNLKLILLIAVGLLATVLVLGLFLNRDSSDKYLPQRFVYRTERLQDITRDGTDVTNNQVRKIASEAGIILSGHVAIIKPLIGTVKSDKTLSAIKAEEQDAAGKKTLEDAKLNGIYDTTYKRLLQQKLQETYALAGEVHDKTSNRKLKTELESLQNDLNTYYRQLQAIQL